MIVVTSLQTIENLGSRDKLELICKECKKSFFKSKHSYYAALNPKTETKLEFCSVRCRNVFNKLRIGLYCKNCNKYLERKRKDILRVINSFCTKKCSAQYNNKSRIKPKNKCRNCKSDIDRHKTYCSRQCQFLFQKSVFISNWLEGKISGVTNNGNSTSKTIKNYLIGLRGNKCEECGWNKINQKTNKVPIQLEHIDGNAENNNINNLKLLCPNCHSLTPTFGSLNKGNGRKSRYKKQVL